MGVLSDCFAADAFAVPRLPLVRLRCLKCSSLSPFLCSLWPWSCRAPQQMRAGLGRDARWTCPVPSVVSCHHGIEAPRSALEALQAFRCLQRDLHVRKSKTSSHPEHPDAGAQIECLMQMAALGSTCDRVHLMQQRRNPALIFKTQDKCSTPLLQQLHALCL